MKALSIKQPWLYCITELDKRVENRTWKPPDWIIGKRIALHSSKKYDRTEYAFASRIARQSLEILDVRGEIVRGAIVATAVVAGWASNSEIGVIYPPFSGDVLDDKWFFGPYGWLLDEIRALPQPIPYRGQLGLWNVDPAILDAGLTTHAADKNGGKILDN